MLASLLRRANTAAKHFSRNVLRGQIGRRIKPWLRWQLKRVLRYLICTRPQDAAHMTIRLPVEGLLAFLGLPARAHGAAWTARSIATLLTAAMPGKPAMAGIYRDISAVLAQGPEPHAPGPAQKLAGLGYGQTVLARAVQAAGIEWDNNSAHCGAYDALKTAELFCNIVNRWRKTNVTFSFNQALCSICIKPISRRC